MTPNVLASATSELSVNDFEIPLVPFFDLMTSNLQITTSASSGGKVDRTI